MHCLGCPSSRGETVEQACMVHGVDVNDLVGKLNAGLGLKGHLGLSAAGGAGSGEILAGTAGSGLAGVTAGLAALGLVLEAALGVELLLAGGEHELVTALLAN